MFVIFCFFLTQRADSFVRFLIWPHAEGITHELKQAGEIQTPSIVAIGARVITILNELMEYQYLLLCVFFLSQDWIAQQRITF